MRKEGRRKRGREGDREGSWILLVLIKTFRRILS